MIVKVADLLAAATQARENYETAKADYDAAAAIWKRRDLKARREKVLPVQRALRDALSAAIKAGKPLTTAQFRDAIGQRGDYFSYIAAPGVQDAPRSFKLDGVQFTAPKGVPLDDLKALEATLSAITDEDISDGQLQRLGFKNMGWVFRAVVGNQ